MPEPQFSAGWRGRSEAESPSKSFHMSYIRLATVLFDSKNASMVNHQQAALIPQPLCDCMILNKKQLEGCRN